MALKLVLSQFRTEKPQVRLPTHLRSLSETGLTSTCIRPTIQRPPDNERCHELERMRCLGRLDPWA